MWERTVTFPYLSNALVAAGRPVAQRQGGVLDPPKAPGRLPLTVCPDFDSSLSQFGQYLNFMNADRRAPADIKKPSDRLRTSQ
jgi:hypothetical protein